ncbi:hypothetical protein TNIN_456041 [Trichonephila inaurata madagascariensis]|uniref:Uncharacterized protein n=1 Tax=Trichonephila inaurata madagascariensis TaxID=2747483 RepID=A0A8X7BTC3_9ARAC|nr:hypothetical protein TNIN_456041 [Trichonephila inaurata madagascariensis]
MHKRATNFLMLQNLLRTQGEEFETIVKILEMKWIGYFQKCFQYLSSCCSRQTTYKEMAPSLYCYILRPLGTVLTIYNPWKSSVSRWVHTWVLGITRDELLPPNLATLWYAAV